VIPPIEASILKPSATAQLPERLRQLWGSLGETALRFFLFPHQEASSERAKLLWLTKLRWLAIALFSSLAVPGLVFGSLRRETVPVYLGILGIIFVVNLFTQLFLKNERWHVSPLLNFVQLTFDLSMLASLLFITGCFANPFVALFLLHAALGAILIRGRLSEFYLILTHLFVGILQLRLLQERQVGLPSSLGATFLVYHFLLFSFWLVMRSLGFYLETQRARQNKQQLLLERQDRLRALGALTAGFSHEFASPLQTAKLRLERLRRKEQSEDIEEALAAIHSCEGVLHQMNSSQLDSRSFQFKSLVISDLLRDITENWQETHPGAQIRIEAEPEIEGHIPPLNFAQVVLNLLDNAYAAAPTGEIVVTFAREQKLFRLSIQDQGPGVPGSILEKLGEPFITTKPHGSGLGLYVSQLFAQSLGGDLKVHNRTGSGATVTLEWPQGRAQA